MTYFLHQPQGIFIRSKEQLLNVGEVLEVGTYVASITPLGEYYLQKAENFSRAKKLYGNVQKKAKRILESFQDRPNSTGVLLSGEQGSGKTMLARELSLMAAEMGMSTIIVNTPFCGAEFNLFIQQIDVPAVVVFDEFEKLYDDEDQEKMLTLLDGLFSSKKLFILTANNMWRIDQHIINRPGRIFYHIKYAGLELDFIREYCEDVLKDKSQIAAVCRISRHFFAFNFDMLKALVEEMNRFGESAEQAVEMLNVSPSGSKDHEHKVALKIEGKLIENCTTEVECSPLNGEPITIHYYGDEGDLPKSKSAKKTPGRTRSHWEFTVDDLKKVDGNVFVFEQEGVELTLTRERTKQFAYHMNAF